MCGIDLALSRYVPIFRWKHLLEYCHHRNVLSRSMSDMEANNVFVS